MSENIVEIFTDGACSGNPGPGGWAALLKYGKHKKELSGFYPNTTNNRMELLAAVRALEALKRPCKVVLYTDSAYLKNGITSWLPKWKSKGWMLGKKRAVKHIDLWKKLDKLNTIHKIDWQWIRGHSGHVENEIVDRLARAAIKLGLKGELAPDPLGSEKNYIDKNLTLGPESIS